MKHIITISTLTLVTFSGLARAQDLTPRAKPITSPLVITNATIHPVVGDVIEKGTIVVGIDGRITSIGGAAGVRPASDASVIDAKGAHLYPGLIDAATQLGVTEILSVRATIDTYETGDMTPEARSLSVINPDSTLIPVARSAGILTVGVFPASPRIAGQPAVVRTDGWTWEEMAIEPSLGVMISWPSPRSRENAKEIGAIDSAFRSALAYRSSRDATGSGDTDLRREALLRVIPGVGAPASGRVFINASSLEQITQSVSWGASMGLSVVIVGGEGAEACTDLLKAHQVPVILSGVFNMPARDDRSYDDGYALPARLDAAGITWCLASGEDPGHIRNITHHAAMSSAYGLPRTRALESITIDAARVLGVADRLGSLEQGKLGTMIMTDGDVLEMTTHVVRAWIDGREVDLTNKQTKQADRYREKYREGERE